MKMFFSLKKSFVIIAITFVMVPSQGFCNIWQQVQDSITTKPTYEEVRGHIRTSDENLVSYSQDKKMLLIADGYVVLTPTRILSFKNVEDYKKKDSVPEFEYVFEKASSSSTQSSA